MGGPGGGALGLRGETASWKGWERVTSGREERAAEAERDGAPVTESRLKSRQSLEG